MMARSRGYPATSLPDAIGRLRKIYDSENTHPADREVIAQAMGYNGRNGASDSTTAALIYYGLLEETSSRQLRISRLGLDILLGERGEADRANAIKTAAFLPDLFSEINAQYGSSGFSNRNLESYLIKSGMTPIAAAKVVKFYRETTDFVNNETQAIRLERLEPRNISPVQEQVVSSASNSRNSRDSSEVETDTNSRTWSFPIDEDTDARVVITGKINQESVDALIDYLNIAKRTLRRNVNIRNDDTENETQND